MKKTIKTIHFKKASDWHYIVPIGDLHVGNVGCKVDKIKELVQWIKDKPNCHWIGMGDYCDCINYKDKRFDPRTISPKYLSNLSEAVSMQIDDVVKLLDPISDKCLGLLRGNHEETIRLRYVHDVMYEMWKKWQLPLLDDIGWVVLRYVHDCNTKKNPCYVLKIVATHGNVGGRTAGYKMNRMEHLTRFYDADVYLMGHSHIKAMTMNDYIFLDNHFNQKHRKRIMAVTGCFLEGYQDGFNSYVEKWMYPPTNLGVVKISFNPARRDIHISE